MSSLPPTVALLPAFAATLIATLKIKVKSLLAMFMMITY
jgi:hypothetical protein